MRPNQQNNNNNNNNKNRSRGRNGGRKHVNPLSRSFESNGPDVKVRGNAAHIAEKYLQLARDAQSSGDSVMAENYLQHAEHYFRIVSAAQQQSGQRPDQFGQDDDFDDDMPEMNSRFSSHQPQQQQPVEAEEQPEAQQVAAAPVQQQASEDAAPAPQQQQAEGERKPRERRPRRRRPVGEAGNGDPANAPQPEVGELPAFITAGGTTTPAE